MAEAIGPVSPGVGDDTICRRAVPPTSPVPAAAASRYGRYSVASGALPIANSLDDQIGGDVDQERDAEQDQSDHEEHLVVRFAGAVSPNSDAMVAVRVRIGSSRLWGICTAWPVAISTAMVSPMARPRPSKTAAKRPFLAAGNRTR